MRTKLLLFFVAFQFCSFIYAQESIDPMRFFPIDVGNKWLYRTTMFVDYYSEEITIDSAVAGEHILYIRHHDFPMYRIDGNFNVYSSYLDGLIYKLNADSGDTWMVNYYTEGFEYSGIKARMGGKHYGSILGKETIIMEIDFYRLMATDTVINENSLFYFRDILALDIGLTNRISGGAIEGCNILGCVIKGDTLGNMQMIAIEDEPIPISKLDFNLSQNYPNPFNPSTTIRYDIKEGTHVLLKVYNSLGEEIETLVNEYKEAGRYTANFKAQDLPSGVYIYRISAGEFQTARKMLFLK